MRIGLITLGCDKNTVDNEYLAGLLESRGFTLEVADASNPPDVAVITTCGFIQAARDQSLAAIDDWLKIRASHGTRVGVIGCLVQRSREELLRRFPGIDFLAGVGEFERVAGLVAGETKSRFLPETKASTEEWNLFQQSGTAKVEAPVIEFDDRAFAQDAPRVLVPRALPRRRMDGRPHGFLKISDGCNHTCTFCSIPLMKGVYSSVPKHVLLDEAKRMLDGGVREINVVAQDVTKYGLDLEKRLMLPELLHDLASLDGHFWIRLFYLYPSTVTRDLLQLMKETPKIARYLDIPLQHLDGNVLKRMKRPHDSARTMDMLRMIRSELPDVTVRTTFIVGFPGESPKEFRALVDGVKEIRFERMGVFTFSREEGTPAAAMPNQVTDKVKQRRKDKLMKLQSSISLDWAQTQIGSEREVLIEGRVQGRDWYAGRGHSEAADIDGVTRVYSEKPLSAGDFVRARVLEADTYDLTAEIIVDSQVEAAVS